MRTTLSMHHESDGRISQVGWTVSDDRGELVATGCHMFANVTNYSRIEALAFGLIYADQDVERNGGVEVPLPF